MNNPPHILIIDDEPSCLRPLMVILTRSGYEVSSASDGHQGLETVESMIRDGKRLDLILCDVSMPNCDGIEFVRELRRKGIETPVAMMTGFADGGTIRMLKDQGCFHVIGKPFCMDEILRAVATILMTGAGPGNGLIDA